MAGFVVVPPILPFLTEIKRLKRAVSLNARRQRNRGSGAGIEWRG
jgi:hypothetical protein